VGNNYDLVVMGTNGADHVYDTWFGTNSYLVAKESAVPVLLLPHDYEYSGFTNIVFAMDYFHELVSPPAQLIQWANLLDAKITVLQIMTEEFRHRHDQRLNLAQQHLNLLLENRHKNFKTIYSDDPIEGIRDYIKANDCDMLALCFRHHSLIQNLFHKNVVKNLSAQSPCPLFIFHQ
jgi:nucleotide-binding universal stress UspA family protein